MKTLLAFWNKDIINKLIVLVFLLLLAGVVALASLLVNMPEGSSLSGVLGEMLPGTRTPTLDPAAVFTRVAQTAQARLGPNATLPAPATSTPEAMLTPEPVLPAVSPTSAQPAETPVPTPSPEPTVIPTATALTGVACLPNTPAESGIVVEVLDGATVRVLVDGLVYIVRYVGLAAPAEPFAEPARLKNAGLVYFPASPKPVQLIPGPVDRDEAGRLLRYVLVDDTFVNLALLEAGFASVVDVPGSDCMAAFQQAEQTARAAGVGQWAAGVTPAP